MRIIHFPKQEHLTTSWSGGTTTQLVIYPFDADFAERDFLFRISTASVENESSTFTLFPGYKRLLMILQGDLHIHHSNRYSKELKTFDTDAFDGSWETSAEGKVQDFNVLYSEEVEQAALEKKELSKGEVHLESLDKCDFIGVYLLSGVIELENVIGKAGDFVLVERSIIKNVFHIKALESAVFLLVQIDVR